MFLDASAVVAVLTGKSHADALIEKIGNSQMPISYSSVTVIEAVIAIARTYGRFVGHPAKLNFRDCFIYAAAKALNVPLLFVGNDFSKTDIAVA